MGIRSARSRSASVRASMASVFNLRLGNRPGLQGIGNHRANWGYGYGLRLWLCVANLGTTTLGTGYGYGYGDGSTTGSTYIRYSIQWTPPGGWTAGNYFIRFLVYGDGVGTAFTTPGTISFTLSDYPYTVVPLRRELLT